MGSLLIVFYGYRSLQINKVHYSRYYSFLLLLITNKININKSLNIKLCKDHEDIYVDKMLFEATGFNEIHVIFDRYISTSLKAKTRDFRNSGIQVRYKVEDDTVISNLSTGQFLSHIGTKHELTIYLSKKLISAFTHAKLKFTVVYDTVCESNILDIDDTFKNHSHEEADTLILLHCMDIAKLDPLRELYISCSDTDVFILLLNFYYRLCNRNNIPNRKR